MYGCESWTVKKAECRRIDAFELWYWRTLESPLDCKEIHQSILKEISPGCSFEGLMLKLKLQHFGCLMRRADSFEKTLMLGKIEGRRRRRRWRMRCWMASPTQWTWVWVDSGSWWLTGRPGVLWFMGSQRVRHTWATELTYTSIQWKVIKLTRKINEAVYNFLFVLSHFSCVRLFVIPWTRVHQAPPSIGFSRQEYWSGSPFPFRWNSIFLIKSSEEFLPL